MSPEEKAQRAFKEPITQGALGYLRCSHGRLWHPEFLEQMPVQGLHTLHKWLAERPHFMLQERIEK